MNRVWWIVGIPGLLFLAFIVFVVVLAIVKLLWASTVPDLFPGAVAEGLIAAEISWWTALKLALFVSVLAVIARASGHRNQG